MPVKKKTVLHMVIDPELKRFLAREAKQSNRTLANLIETALIDYRRRCMTYSLSKGGSR